jgi:hypothetical protein
MQSRKEQIMSSTRWADKAHLFYYPPCNVPAWYPLIDEMIELVEEFNEHSPWRIRFFQIKEKFGMLVAYIEPLPEDNREGDNQIPIHMQTMIDSIANEGHKICRICHERKVETVVESRLQWRCLDHWESDRFRRRE